MTFSARLLKLLVLAMFLFVFAAACTADPNPVRARTQLKVGPATFSVEIANDDAQRELGLMYRRVMADNEGMLFIFDRDQDLNFWMKNTILPLSIAYISSRGEIKEILDMVPQSLANVPSTYAVRYALEVNKGAFQRAGVKVGDTVILP